MASNEIRAVLLHLGENMWCDWTLDPAEDAKLGEKAPHRKMRIDESIWQASVDLAHVQEKSGVMEAVSSWQHFSADFW